MNAGEPGCGGGLSTVVGLMIGMARSLNLWYILKAVRAIISGRNTQPSRRTMAQALGDSMALRELSTKFENSERQKMEGAQ